MTKKAFLKKLREKIKILNEEEIDSILDEYEQKIDYEIQNGKDEKEAVEQLGDIELIAEKILDEHKIRHEKSFSEEFNSFVKKCANKLSSLTKTLAKNINDNNIPTDTIFEIIIKVIILLFTIFLLQLPFYLISNLGNFILNILIFPIDKIMIFIWQMIIWITYLIVCIIIGILLFKNSEKNIFESKNIKQEEKTIIKNKDIKEKTYTNDVKDNNSNSIKHNFIYYTLKITSIIILIPVWCVIISLSVALAITVYYTITGINLFGIILILIGIIVFFSFIANIFENMLNKKRIRFLSNIILSLIFITIGSIITIDTFKDYEFFDSMNILEFDKVISTKEFDVNNKTYIQKCNKIIDNNIANNKIKIEYSYYNEILSINSYKNNNGIYFDKSYIDSSITFKLYNNIINNLKEKKMYNYGKLFDYDVNVYVNENTIHNVVCNNH